MEKIFLIITIALAGIQCNSKSISSTTQQSGSNPGSTQASNQAIPGASQLDMIIPLLKNKSVALAVNHTSLVGNTHLVDTLKSLGIHLVKIFAPEHGFRGTADAGEHVKNATDKRTNLPLVSLYGKNKKPTAEQLADVDVVIFDIQDVGVRFFTYISTMHYLMEACAENNKTLIILDRPNPNGSYIDGPIMQPKFKSFVGMHPIPIVHGLTVGELAQMINGEGWLENKVKCYIEIITVKHWQHTAAYSCPVKPSPNLPDDQAIKLYPSTCLFEGTAISVGRGTYHPFEIVGHPDLKNYSYEFTPLSIEGMAKNPPFENKKCYGLDLRNVKVESKIDLKYLKQLYNDYPDKEHFFIPYFDTLVGNDTLKQQIKNGLTEEQIREGWKADLTAYEIMRKKYLLYE